MEITTVTIESTGANDLTGATYDERLAATEDIVQGMVEYLAAHCPAEVAVWYEELPTNTPAEDQDERTSYDGDGFRIMADADVFDEDDLDAAYDWAYYR